MTQLPRLTQTLLVFSLLVAAAPACKRKTSAPDAGLGAHASATGSATAAPGAASPGVAGSPGLVASSPSAAAAASAAARPASGCLPDLREHVMLTARGWTKDGAFFVFLSEGHYTVNDFSDANIAVVRDARTQADTCYLISVGELDIDDDAKARLRPLLPKARFEAWLAEHPLAEEADGKSSPDGTATAELEADGSRVKGQWVEGAYDYVCRGAGAAAGTELEEAPNAPPCGSNLRFFVQRGSEKLFAGGRTVRAGNLGDVTPWWSADGRKVAWVHNADDRSAKAGAFVEVLLQELPPPPSAPPPSAPPPAAKAD